MDDKDLLAVMDYAATMEESGAPNWYTPWVEAYVISVKHVVLRKVEVGEFSETNPIPRNADKKKAEKLEALKLSTESDNYISDASLMRSIDKTDWKMKSLKIKWRRMKIRMSYKMN